MEKQKKYYLGLDIGTNSVGYAATDREYNLLKYHGETVWGSMIFDEAEPNAERRTFRTARRRLDRRQQRVTLIQELFAKEIMKNDEKFFWRLKGSALFREEAGEPFPIFNDRNYTDKEYHTQYPTIHHLICDLMTSDKPHDARLVYLACAWLVAHRGHFLSNIDMAGIKEIKRFDSVYNRFLSFFNDNGYHLPWKDVDVDALSDCLKSKTGVTAKYTALVSILCDGVKPKKKAKEDSFDSEFPFSLEGIIKLLAGGKYSLRDLFGKEEYAELEIKSVDLGMDEEKFAQIMADIGDDYDLIAALRSIRDWSVLVETMGDSECISQAKVKIY